MPMISLPLTLCDDLGPFSWLDNWLSSKRPAYFKSHQSTYIIVNLLVYLCTIAPHETRFFTLFMYSKVKEFP